MLCELHRLILKRYQDVLHLNISLETTNPGAVSHNVQYNDCRRQRVGTFENTAWAWKTRPNLHHASGKSSSFVRAECGHTLGNERCSCFDKDVTNFAHSWMWLPGLGLSQPKDSMASSFLTTTLILQILTWASDMHSWHSSNQLGHTGKNVKPLPGHPSGCDPWHGHQKRRPSHLDHWTGCINEKVTVGSSPSGT